MAAVFRYDSTSVVLVWSQSCLFFATFCGEDRDLWDGKQMPGRGESMFWLMGLLFGAIYVLLLGLVHFSEQILNAPNGGPHG